MKKRRRVPARMRAAAIDKFGKPDVLKIHELPVPEVGANDVLIALDTVGVGIWDSKARKGAWAESKDFPMILGVDGAGVVAAVGANVKRFDVGDAVYSYSYGNARGGFYAEYVSVAQGRVALVPRGLDPLQAGGIATVGLTSLQGIDDALSLGEDESIIILGASGNVGMMAVQFARARRARILAIASGSDGVAFALGLGANVAIDGKSDDIAAAAGEFAPNGADALLVSVGGKQVAVCMDALRSRGRVAYPNGVEPAPRKRKGIKLTAYDATPGVREFDRLNRTIEDAYVHCPIAETFNLVDAATAHRRIEQGHVLGKVVLRIT